MLGHVRVGRGRRCCGQAPCRTVRVEDGVGFVAGECGRAGDRVDVQYRRGVVRKVGGLVPHLRSPMASRGRGGGTLGL